MTTTTMTAAKKSQTNRTENGEKSKLFHENTGNESDRQIDGQKSRN